MSKRLKKPRDFVSETEQKVSVTPKKDETILGTVDLVYSELESAHANWKRVLSRPHREDLKPNRPLFDYIALHLDKWEGKGIEGWENIEIASFFDEISAVNHFRRFTLDHNSILEKPSARRMILLSHVSRISTEDFVQEAITADWGRQNILSLQHYIDAAEASLDRLYQGYKILHLAAVATAHDSEHPLSELALQTLADWELTERKINSYIQDLKDIVRRTNEAIATAAFVSKKVSEELDIRHTVELHFDANVEDIADILGLEPNAPNLEEIRSQIRILRKEGIVTIPKGKTIRFDTRSKEFDRVLGRLKTLPRMNSKSKWQR